MFQIAFEAISTLSLEELSKKFYSKFDGIVTERGGRIVVTVYVADGTSRIESACDLIPQLEQMEFSIVCVDQDLVDGPEIAARLGLKRQAVDHWARGTRGSGFPFPRGCPGGKRIWTWGQITAWLPPKYEEPTALTPDEAAQIDNFLVQRRLKVSGGVRVPVGHLAEAAGGTKDASLAGDYFATKLRFPGHVAAGRR